MRLRPKRGEASLQLKPTTYLSTIQFRSKDEFLIFTSYHRNTDWKSRRGIQFLIPGRIPDPSTPVCPAKNIIQQKAQETDPYKHSYINTAYLSPISANMEQVGNNAKMNHEQQQQRF